jgi:tetratricopeptide (TPR) repeat protein
MPRIRALVVSLLPAVLALTAPAAAAQHPVPDQLQISPPPLHQVEPPDASATAEELEVKGDSLRRQKFFLDALDYYEAARSKNPNSAPIHNKIGMCELQLHWWPKAKQEFERAIKVDHQYAEAYNNLGVSFYGTKKFSKAISKYQKAIDLRPASASFYSNLGAAYFSVKDFQRSALAYAKALELDPDVFERSSRDGIAAQMAKPEDRARYDYEIARLYAKMGVADRSLLYLRRAMEEGYKNIESVYKDTEFAGLRKDPRFTELMGARPPGITE